MTPAKVLESIYNECAMPDWDGYGAAPLSAAAYEEAIRFVDAMPSWLPVPDIGPEPSGDIGFEWNNGKDRIFAASVDGTNTITYAGILGKDNDTSGTEVFHDAIPLTIIQSIERIYS